MTIDEFRLHVEAEAQDLRESVLAASFADIAERYDAGRSTPATLTRTDVAAYAVGRGVATFAAVEKVLTELTRVRPGWGPRSMLDLGAGVGSATWAARSVFRSLESVTLVERSPEMLAFGRKLLAADWVAGDVLAQHDGADLVIAAYVLGELTDDTVVERWFASARAELVIVEAGTPAGFERIRRARARLIDLGATITAPCPHEDACPMAPRDWCHFGVRVQRSRVQRFVKGGDRGFEDEKYSYVVASKQGAVERVPRVLRHPQRRTGHVRLHLCAPEGLREMVVSRKQARKVGWGDVFGEH